MDDLKIIESSSIREIGNFLEEDAVLCNKIGCMDENHLMGLQNMYKTIVTSVSNGSRQFARQKRKKNKFKVIPGWNRRVKFLHKRARENYLRWLERDRQRGTHEFVCMSDSKREFKKALNQCKLNEKQEIDISIGEKFKLKNYTEFWKDVRQRRIITKRSNIIDDKNANEDILHIFTQKFLRFSR